MKVKDILTEKEGGKLFLLGNEAAVRGALESGVSLVSTYPGTPSSEIGDVFYKIAKEAGVYFEFSVNEKVALEVSAAAASAGLRSFVFMKHVGLNVAADSFMSVVYTGVQGGMIVLSADDPSMYSSQNEQDNRIMARLAGIPLLEPSNPQEIKDLMKFGFELSEQFEIPVLMRTTTRTSHMRGVVNLGPVIKGKEKGYFKKNPEQYVVMPSYVIKLRKELMEKLNKIKGIADSSPVNKIIDKGGKVLGIITSGGAFNYVIDIINENDLKAKILKLAFSYPFPEKLVLDFINNVDNILVDRGEKMKNIYKIHLIGVGGQGTVKASTIVGEAAMKKGLNVVMSEVHGMAQRGGTVVTELKIGEAQSPLIEEGAADLLIAFEPTEALRSFNKINCNSFVIVNSAPIVPFTVSLGISEYPELSYVFKELKTKIKNLLIIDAQKIAKEAGSIISENMVLLGAAAAVPNFPVDKKLIIQSMEENLPPKSVEMNLKAFELGFKEVKK